ncbi:MAG: hypothetical protein SVR94_03615, partial [Pseudomonadota bacterium]|nr:hypothetical protein [Pseudomonadota bacterium]
QNDDTFDCTRKTLSINPDNRWQQRLHESALSIAISRQDPHSAGFKLLAHNLAKVRQGAWIILGQIPDIELLKRLIQARAQRLEEPHFRHAADHNLLTLEGVGDEQTLIQLQALKKQVLDSAIDDRLAWNACSIGCTCAQIINYVL